jgi:hypothetical protein
MHSGGRQKSPPEPLPWFSFKVSLRTKNDGVDRDYGIMIANLLYLSKREKEPGGRGLSFFCA